MPDDHAEPAPVDRTTFRDRYAPRALVAGGAKGLGTEITSQLVRPEAPGHKEATR